MLRARFAHRHSGYRPLTRGVPRLLCACPRPSLRPIGPSPLSLGDGNRGRVPYDAVRAIGRHGYCTNRLAEHVGSPDPLLLGRPPYLHHHSGALAGFGNGNSLLYPGDPAPLNLNAPIVGAAATQDGRRYSMVAADAG